MFSHGYLGRGNRKVAPSCVVWKIRDSYPAPDNIYLGFREHWNVITFLLHFKMIVHVNLDFLLLTIICVSGGWVCAIVG